MAIGTEDQETSGVIFPPPFYYAIGVGAGFVLSRFYPASLTPVEYSMVLRIAGVIIFALAAALAASAILRFKRAGTNVQPIKPTLALVVVGPYRFTRNPMYLGLALAGFSIAIYFNALWAVLGNAVAMFCIDRNVIRKEERYLEGKFGEDYRRFKQRVRRWI